VYLSGACKVMKVAGQVENVTMANMSAHERFEAIYARVRDPLHRYLSRRASADSVDDLFTEVLIVLWRRLEDVPDGGEVPWALAVARRTLSNHRRAHSRFARLLAKLALFEPGVDPGPEPRGGDPDLEQALATLRESDREVLRLFAWEELTTGEIGVVLGLSANAAGVRLHRAKERLRNALANAGKENKRPGQEGGCRAKGGSR
jgi:RNA polymerase sigma-70 factor (ECF subfamily)